MPEVFDSDKKKFGDWNSQYEPSVQRSAGTENFASGQTRNLTRVALAAILGDEKGLATKLHHVQEPALWRGSNS